MATNSHIEWTGSTWNPLTGCSKISPGCKNCYAERMAHRLQAMKQPNYENGFNLTLHEKLLPQPFFWKKPKMIFVNSMSDLFHKDVPLSFIKKVFHVIQETPWHTYQILTKRAARLFDVSESLQWPKNLWMGVSVENIDYLDRIEYLRQTQAAVKFVSFEPLIGPINYVNLTDINWAIVGGESGPKSRAIQKEWILRIKDICEKANTAFYFKQWGGFNKKKNGNLLDGLRYQNFPELAIK